MLTSSISFKNFKKKIESKKISKTFRSIINNKNQVIESLGKNYKYSYKLKKLKKYKKISDFRIIGMGGSILGTQAIYDFLRHKIKKNFSFVNNLQNLNLNLNKNKKKYLNLVVSKSGNTIETIVNSNILIKKKDSNIFITENKNNYLYKFAEQLKSEVVHHNNFIGGRYSVLSEVGMLPAEFMGLKTSDFKQLNLLIKNKRFLNSLIKNVSSILYYIKNKKFNSIIINYDEKSENYSNGINS